MASEALSDNKVEQSPKEDDSLDDSDANTPKQEPAPDENTVDEADSIVQNFSAPYEWSKYGLSYDGVFLILLALQILGCGVYFSPFRYTAFLCT